MKLRTTNSLDFAVKLAMQKTLGDAEVLPRDRDHDDLAIPVEFSFDDLYR